MKENTSLNKTFWTMKFMAFLFAILVLPVAVYADSQCGPYRLGTSPANDGWARINGVKPESQKVIFLKQKDDYDNIKMVWTMATTQPGLWIGMEYIKRDGKAILNTQQCPRQHGRPKDFWNV